MHTVTACPIYRKASIRPKVVVVKSKARRGLASHSNSSLHRRIRSQKEESVVWQAIQDFVREKKESEKEMDSGTDLEVSRLSVSSTKYKDSTLRRQDKEIERLTKVNFDLQLRLFHLEEQLAQLDESVDFGNAESRFINIMEDKQKELEHKDDLLVKARQVIYALQNSIETLRAGGEIENPDIGDHGQNDSSIVIDRLLTIGEELGEARQLLGEAESRVEVMQQDAEDAAVNTAEILNLKDQLRMMEAKYHEAVDSNEDLRNELDAEMAANEALKASSERLQEAENLTSTLQKKIAELENALAQQQLAEEELRGEIGTLQEINAEREKEHQESLQTAQQKATLRVSELEEVLSACTTASSEWGEKLEKAVLDERKKAQELREELTQLHLDLDEKNINSEAAEEKIEALELEVARCRAEKENLENKLNEGQIDWASNVEGMTKETEFMKEKIETLEQELGQHRSERENLDSNAGNLQSQLEEQTKNSLAQKDKLEREIEANTEAFEAQIHALEKQVEALGHEKQVLEQERHDHVATLESRAESLENALQQLHENGVLKEALSEELEAAKLKIESSRTECEHLDNEVTDLRKELEAMMGKTEAESDEVKRRRTEFEKLRSDLEVVKKERETKEALRSQLEEECNILRLKNQSLEEANESLKRKRDSETEKLSSDLQALTEKESVIEAQRIQLEEECESLREKNEALQEESETASMQQKNVIEEHEKAIEALESNYEVLKLQHDELKSEHAEVSDLLAKVSKNEDEAQEAGEEMGVEIQNLWDMIDTATDDAKHWKEASDEHETQSKKWRELAQGFEKELLSVRTEREEIATSHGAQLEAAEKQMKMLRRDRDQTALESTQQVSDFQDQLRALKVGKDRSDSLLAELSEKIQDLENRLRKSVADLSREESLRVEMENVQAEMQSAATQLESRVGELVEELEIAKRDLVMQQSERSAEQAKRKQAETQLDENRAENCRLATQVASLQVSLDEEIFKYKEQEVEIADLEHEVRTLRAAEEREKLLADEVEKLRSFSSVAEKINPNVLHELKNLPSTQQSQIQLPTGPWKPIVFRQLEKSRALSAQLSQSVELHRKTLLDDLVA
ncbi:hypothetical protein NDN08_001855 [Rhodosorus marinus]|uniref:Centrosomin N-terminal motif 1 domain-containing protein n=1 Tax=Rhodosorus marinus TaxID=101924 RepID=A0AAV8UW70_9RHOD|nr:hypothetical protein NDN08_001855 [Rhodosorus marinus]